jgi:hypothetical protein
MGQNISTTNNNENDNNNIQTNIEVLLDDLLDRNYNCDDLNNEEIISIIQQHITKTLNKTLHDQLVIMYKQIDPEKNKNGISGLNINELIKYYTQKIISTMCIYTLRDSLMNDINKMNEVDMNSIRVLNNKVNNVNKLDDLAKMLVEEVIHTSYTSDGKMRKKRYIRERQLTRKQLEMIMKELKAF